jgi:hypothetical protein
MVTLFTVNRTRDPEKSGSSGWTRTSNPPVNSAFQIGRDAKPSQLTPIRNGPRGVVTWVAYEPDKAGSLTTHGHRDVESRLRRGGRFETFSTSFVGAGARLHSDPLASGASGRKAIGVRVPLPHQTAKRPGSGPFSCHALKKLTK